MADSSMQAAFDALVGAADPAMVIVTTAHGSVRAGCLVGFHQQTSIDPQEYGVWLSRSNHTYRAALEATHCAVHFLSASDVGIAERFGSRTGDDGDKFDGLRLEEEYGVPVLADLAHRLVLERTALVDDGGDHVGFLGRVRDARSGGSFEPLRLSDVAHIQPGHRSGER